MSITDNKCKICKREILQHTNYEREYNVCLYKMESDV